MLTLACPLLYDSVGGAGWPGYDLRIAAFTLATVAALAHDALEPAAQIRNPNGWSDPMSDANASIPAGITRPSSPP